MPLVIAALKTTQSQQLFRCSLFYVCVTFLQHNCVLFQPKLLKIACEMRQKLSKNYLSSCCVRRASVLLICRCLFKRKLAAPAVKALGVITLLATMFQTSTSALAKIFFFGAFSERWQALAAAAKLPSMPCGRAGFVLQS